MDRSQWTKSVGTLFDSEVGNLVWHVRLVDPHEVAVEDAARAEPRVAVGAEVLLALGVDLAHVALHGAPLLVGLVANEAEVAPARQHPHRGGHQGAPIGVRRRMHSSAIYKKNNVQEGGMRKSK